MESFARNSRNITTLIAQFQNKIIDEKSFNQKILINVLLSYTYQKKESKKTKEIQLKQNLVFQSYFKKEAKQEEEEKKLIAKIRDKKSKEIIENDIRKQREKLINDLFKQNNIKFYVEQTYNSYIPPKNLSLSLYFHINKNNRYVGRYISESNADINYINPNMNRGEEAIKSNYFIESPIIKDYSAPQNFSLSNSVNSIDIEGEELDKILDTEDEILFYDESLAKDEKMKNLGSWLKKTEISEINNNFNEFSKNIEENNAIGLDQDLFFILPDGNNKKSKRDLRNSMASFEGKITTTKDRFNEFRDYLTEKNYNIYIKKMNYYYLFLMLMTYYDLQGKFEQYMCLNEHEVASNFIKKILLFSGISCMKLYEQITYIISNKKGKFTFQQYLDCFNPIFEASEKYQCCKYKFLLYLVKDHFNDTISRYNFKIFLNLIKVRSIYESETCDDIRGKLLPIIKKKYPKDNFNELNYLHVSIILEYLVDFEYGD